MYIKCKNDYQSFELIRKELLNKGFSPEKYENNFYQSINIFGINEGDYIYFQIDNYYGTFYLLEDDIDEDDIIELEQLKSFGNPINDYHYDGVKEFYFDFNKTKEEHKEELDGILYDISALAIDHLGYEVMFDEDEQDLENKFLYFNSKFEVHLLDSKPTSAIECHPLDFIFGGEFGDDMYQLITQQEYYHMLKDKGIKESDFISKNIDEQRKIFYDYEIN